MVAIFHQIFYKVASILISIAMLFGASGDCLKADSSDWNTNYKFVFVHGLSGWGSYDSQYKLMPYWGMFGGDLMKYLNDKGFDCYAASVAPSSSAWDRACELYAQLTGTVVDYGKEHSERCGHERFGKDYSGIALIDEFDEENKINLLGHSFGGATVRIFASLMENGSEAEMEATDESEISGFFTGGKGDWIYSIITLAAPHNGTTAYDTDPADGENAGSSKIEQMLSSLVSLANDMGGKDGRIAEDYADYDMKIDNALEMNKSISTLKNTYYFSIPCNASIEDENGNYTADSKKMEILFRASSNAMGAYTGTTEKGFVIDDSWKMNDGLVNTVSAMAPLGAPQKDYDETNVEKGVWNIMPIYDGDHMSLQGGLFNTNDVKGLYVDLLSMINAL